MESKNPESEFVTPTINEKYNCKGQIHSFLTRIDDKKGQDAKLVIFVPIKCELWARQKKLDEVTKAVKDFYSVSLQHLEKYKSLQIEMIPIQTLGSVIFKEHLEPYVFFWKEKRLIFFEKDKRSKCSMLEDGTIRLADGSIKDPKTGNLQPDGDAFLIKDNPDFIRPNTWFHFESSKYEPHNCEQLAYHILEFMLNKAIDAKIREEENQSGFVKMMKRIGNTVLNVGTLGIYNELVKIFGSISIEKMQEIMKEMNRKHLIKYRDEGIEIYKACNFKTNKK